MTLNLPEHSADVAEDFAAAAIPAVVVTTSTKAFVGAIVAGVTSAGAALVQALSDGTIQGNEWVTVIAAGLIGAGVVGPSVYGAVNKRVVS